MTQPLESVLDKLQGVKQCGGEYKALCPAHDDKQASLSVTEGDGGRVLLYCHAGCEPAAIVEAIGMKLSDLFPKAAATPARIVATYDYHDAGGKLVYQAVRFDPKDFRQRRPDGNGGWLWNMGGVQRVPYRLPRVLDAVGRGEAVYIVEGEKDVATLESIGLVATTNAGGAAKWLQDYCKPLKGASVVILPDNDEPGRNHAQDAAAMLTGKAVSVKIVDLSGLKAKGDVSDWAASGHTASDLHALVDAAPEWTPPGPAEAQPAAGRDFSLTDLGNAERLIAVHGDDLRFDVNAGKWLVWNGKRWEVDSTNRVDRMAMSVVRRMHDTLKTLDGKARDELYGHIKKSESAPRLAAMTDLARKLDGVPVESASLDHDPFLLNCLNGTLNLRTGELQPHTRGDMITRLAPVEYDAAAQAPRWMQFLGEVFQEGNGEITAFVKRMAGYCATGDTREQTLFLLTGKGSNGKSTLVEVLRAVLGDYGANTPFTTFTEGRDSNTSDLAGLMGKRLVTASEGEEAQSFNESVLKIVTGGDPVTCRHLYRDFFSYVPTYKVLFSTNEIPRIRSQNHAMRRRIKLIPFRQRFYDPTDGKTPVKDDQLLPKLLAEKSGILAWAVEGCLEWQRSGLSTPAAIRAEVERLFESQDVLAEFIDSECTVSSGAEVPIGDLWQAYRLWCDETGRKSAFKQPQGFSRSLTQRDGIDAERRHGGLRVLTGIGLVSVMEGDGDEGDEKTVFSEHSSCTSFTGRFAENTESSSPLVTLERENAVPGDSRPGNSETISPFSDADLLLWGAANDWPRLSYKPGYSIAGEESYRVFSNRADTEDRRLALATTQRGNHNTKGHTP